MDITRRTLLAVAPAALAGCAGTGGSLDVARIAAGGEAVVAALQAMLAAPAVIVLLGADAAVATAALAMARAALAGLAKARLAAVADTAEVRALAATLIRDAQSVIGLVQRHLADAPGEAIASIEDYLAAAQALLPSVALPPEISARG